MKLLVFTTLILGFITLVLWRTLTIPFTPLSPTMTALLPTPTAPIDPWTTTVSMPQGIFTVSWFPVDTAKKLQLIPNFSEQFSSTKMKESCAYFANASFYDTNHQPLGLFRSNGKTMRPAVHNALINGFFVTDGESGASIIEDIPDTTAPIALQSGPVLIQHGISKLLKIKNDTPDRRIVLAITEEEKIIFFILYSPQSVFSGPFLTDLPKLVQTIGLNQKMNITEAINLDGGSASAFFNGTTRLSELSPVGAFFCVQ